MPFGMVPSDVLQDATKGNALQLSDTANSLFFPLNALLRAPDDRILAHLG